MAYVYYHRRLDNDDVFYIGKGSTNRKDLSKGRNAHWRYIAKNGWSSEVLMDNLTDDEAYELETFVIETIGLENLTNVDAGGRGRSCGSIPWNKDTVGKSIGGRKPGTPSHIKGVKMPYGQSSRKGTTTSYIGALSAETGIPIRTLHSWYNENHKPYSKHRLEIYDQIIKHKQSPVSKVAGDKKP